MHVHILGVCGTFMGSLAQLAKAQGHRVTGSDTAVYPPMSTQLAEAGIEIIEGYDPAQLKPEPDIVVVGNAMSRGNPVVEALLNTTIPYVSGPQWLHDHVLKEKWVLAVAGTHGKTTTTSMLAWILEYAGMSPGYLIGGVPANFGQSAKLSDESPFFVVEADEYDTAFFDKRSKFVHYSPRTLVMNNLEYDHADIFPDLAAIQTQFHHVIRIVPENGRVIYPANTPALDEVIEKGCWTPQEKIALTDKAKSNLAWRAELIKPDGSHFTIHCDEDNFHGDVVWQSTGDHNVMNALAATAAARHVGVAPETAIEALATFKGVKRRMESLGIHNGVTVYDDFAHHPTAIKTTLSGLRANVGSKKIIALIEPRSNTMRLGIHQENLVNATTDADHVIWFQPPNIDWSLDAIIENSQVPAEKMQSIDETVERITALAEPDTHVVIMSNGGFGGIHQKIVSVLKQK